MKSCKNCGFCCKKAPCAAAARIYGNVTKCPALKYDEREKRYFCDLMCLPGKLGIAYRHELGAGTGCCCGLNTDRNNILPPESEPVPMYRMSADLQVFLSALGKAWVSPDTIYLACLRASKILNEPRFMDEAQRLFKSQRSKASEEFMGD